MPRLPWPAHPMIRAAILVATACAVLLLGVLLYQITHPEPTTPADLGQLETI